MQSVRRAIAPLLGLGAALGLYAGTRDLDQIAREGQLGPGFWPRLALIGLGAGCLAKIVEEWRRHHRSEAAGAAGSEPLPPISRGRLGGGIALILGYVLLTPWVGFPLVTALFIATFMRLGGMRSVRAIAANVLIGTVGLLYLFVKLVYLPLPKGEGPLETFTLALYRALGIF